MRKLAKFISICHRILISESLSCPSLVPLSLIQNRKSYNFVKYQFARKITSSESEEYRMTFGGSSVTAGHDNQYTQSYPEVVGRKIRPVLESFGIPTLIHNVAQGANGCFPSNYCYESMGGFDPDFVGWSVSLFPLSYHL
jgi:hypothetical protein